MVNTYEITYFTKTCGLTSMIHSEVYSGTKAMLRSRIKEQKRILKETVTRLPVHAKFVDILEIMFTK